MASKMTYEQALSRLEEIAAELRNGKLTLDESVKLYEEGVKLAKFAGDCLDGAAKKLRVLSGEAEEE
ncbi:MAG: exodeoxyribonuclease VII small subunit [Clostridia bacterium]|nr:exodeoxyribonuclease VII small subunit [Clostridia bacterium]